MSISLILDIIILILVISIGSYLVRKSDKVYSHLKNLKKDETIFSDKYISNELLYKLAKDNNMNIIINYDKSKNSCINNLKNFEINLDDTTYEKNTVRAITISLHEFYHAFNEQKNHNLYRNLKLSFLFIVLVTNVILFFSIMNNLLFLIYSMFFLYLISLIFSVISLFSEYHASRLTLLKIKELSDDESIYNLSQEMLKTAYMTYVLNFLNKLFIVLVILESFIL